MNESIINTYLKYIKKIQGQVGDRKVLYKTVAQEFKIKNALYPGSHIDITPSMVIPKVTYVDNFKGAISFFKHTNEIDTYIAQTKEYKGSAQITFIGKDYRDSLDIEKVDLIISQYAGFVGQDTKEALKVGGVLLCNDSHGDASLAHGDEDYQLIGVINDPNKIETTNLEDYFKLRQKTHVDLDKVKRTMKGLNYRLKAKNYLFQKIK